MKFILNILIALSIHYFVLILYFWRVNKKYTIVLGTGNGLLENNVERIYYGLIQELDKASIFFVSEYASHELSIKYNGRVIKIGSVNAYLQCLRADALVIDTCNSDVAPGLHKFVKGFKINVNHGFEGLKKLPQDYFKKIDADVHVASSDFEAKIKIHEMGANPGSVVVTGYPRFDVIDEARSGNDILAFFTWRDWSLYDDDHFQDYIGHLETLVCEEVSNALGRRTLFIKLHPKIKSKIISQFDNIIILGEFDNLTSYVRQCSVLITDYSSVTWDFVYNQRNVIFYCYDYEEYRSVPGLYVDYEKYFAKSMAQDIKALINMLEKSESEIDGSRYFRYRDGQSTRRILDIIYKNIEKKEVQ